MKLIPLTRGLFAKVDAADFDWLNQWKWYALSSGKGRFYAARDAKKNGSKMTILMHRVILTNLGNLEGEHANRNSLDNQQHNLRPATSSQNKANRTIAWGSNPYRGVYPRLRGGFDIKIAAAGRNIYLGCSYDAEEGAVLYDSAARILYKDFATLNFPTVNKTLPKELLEKIKTKTKINKI
jgi:hypothetical protein